MTDSSVAKLATQDTWQKPSRCDHKITSQGESRFSNLGRHHRCDSSKRCDRLVMKLVAVHVCVLHLKTKANRLTGDLAEI